MDEIGWNKLNIIEICDVNDNQAKILDSKKTKIDDNVNQANNSSLVEQYSSND